MRALPFRRILCLLRHVTLALPGLIPLTNAETTLQIHDSIDGLVTRPWPDPGNEPVRITVSGPDAVTLSAWSEVDQRELWRMPLERDAEGNLTAEVPARFGVLRLEARKADNEVLARKELGVIPPFHPGIRPDSFFASNTSSVRRGEDLKLLQTIGMKVQRAHIQEFTPAQFEEVKASDTWVLPIVGYAQPLELSPLALRLRQHGPPADFDAFVAWWREHLQRFPEIKTWEFWNEPWIFEWTWADTPEAYRRLQRMWAEMALKVNPELCIIAGNSWMFVQDHLEPYPESWKGLLRGITHHPYSSSNAATFRAGDLQRSIDAGFLINRQMGLERYYLTEGGTNVGNRAHGGSLELYPHPSNPANARKLVKLYVISALSGVFQANAQWHLGYGSGWTHSNTSFAVMSHLLEDRPVLAEIWPSHDLLRGAVFGNARQVDEAVRALPRAAELAARWEVPVPEERRNDDVKVAVLWSWTGASQLQMDESGTLSLDAAPDLTAYDLYGRPLPSGQDGRLTLPFGKDPVYILSRRLTAAELRERIADAHLEEITPLNVMLQPLQKSADQAQDLGLRIQSQYNRPLRASLRLFSPGMETVVSDFRVEPGALLDLSLPWPGVPLQKENQYPVAVRVEIQTLSGEKLPVVERAQVLQSARFVRREIQVDGEAGDWEGIPSVNLTKRSPIDLTRFLLNPHLNPLEAETAEEGSLRVHSAYDDKFVYIAVRGLGTKTRIGDLFAEGLPWRLGKPDGLRFAALMADNVQLAFGFRDRVPGHGRQTGDPRERIGHVYDTDHLFIVHPTRTDGDQVVRLWGPDTDRRIAYQTVPLPHVQVVPGAKAVLREGFWEIAIPREELPEFISGPGTFRFGILVNGRYNWADTAGVFDHWKQSGSFNPSWEFYTPAQTYHGIDP